jgi:hypothetical protein
MIWSPHFPLFQTHTRCVIYCCRFCCCLCATPLIAVCVSKTEVRALTACRACGHWRGRMKRKSSKRKIAAAQTTAQQDGHVVAPECNCTCIRNYINIHPTSRKRNEHFYSSSDIKNEQHQYRKVIYRHVFPLFRLCIGFSMVLFDGFSSASVSF